MSIEHLREELVVSKQEKSRLKVDLNRILEEQQSQVIEFNDYLQTEENRLQVELDNME